MALTRKGERAGEHFVEHRAKRKNIAAAIEFFAFHLLRRHVVERADDRALLRYGRGVRGRRERGAAENWSSRARQTKIEELGARWRDRKSTRLNSSHVEISYAVFCLKKKKKKK